MESREIKIGNGDRSGFEYGCRIWRDDSLVSTYSEEIECWCAYHCRWFLLEVRTNFILKPYISVDQILDSERFASIIAMEEDEEMMLLGTRYRLTEYWLPPDEIRRVVHEAFFFAKRMEYDDTRNACLHVIPLVVSIDVCTVQLRREPLADTFARCIKPDRLIPFQVLGMSIVQADGTRQKGLTQSKETMEMCLDLRMYLMDLPRERVEDVGKGKTRMEECPVCFKSPVFGSELTPLPCGHVFHNHCIVQFLMNSKTAACPVCHFQIIIPTT